MKTKIFFLPLMLIFMLSMSACGTKAESETFSEYKCPMNCENKNYDKAGACPVCGMDLVGVSSKK